MSRRSRGALPPVQPLLPPAQQLMQTPLPLVQQLMQTPHPSSDAVRSRRLRRIRHAGAVIVP